jgi:RNase H-like domain found in reverse transcriptase
LAYIRRFIANLLGKIQPFTRLTKKDIPFKWDGECQRAFEEIKAYLLNPPVLAAPIPGKELILYTTALDGSLGALLAQENQDGNQNALYYLSRIMVGAEHGYSPIEKYYLALIFAVKKLRHYMLAHKIILISKVDPLKYLMTWPMLTGRLAKWAIILTEFDITYMPQKAIKGQALADF